MSHEPIRKRLGVTGITRRTLLIETALAGAALAAPAVLHGIGAQAQAGPAAPGGNIDWKQAAGEEITVAVIPAGYFDNLVEVTHPFEQATGIKVRYEKIPPGQIRNKAVLDLSSKTGTYATHAADPMYYPLYVANKWVDPLDAYLTDPKLTDRGWYAYEDILEGWRNAVTLDGKPYGIPYDGEVTIQVYRKDAYEKAGIKPADTLEEFTANAAKVNDPTNRLWGAALRGFRG